jgi:AraC-like DNA-binding protein
LEIQTRLHHFQTLPGVEFVEAAYTHHCFPKHFHDYYVIQIVEVGVNKGVCRGERYAIESNALMVINPGEVHDGFSHEGQYLAYRSLYITPEAMKAQLALADVYPDRHIEFSALKIQNSQYSLQLKDLMNAVSVGDQFEIQSRLLLLIQDLLVPYASVPNRCFSHHRDPRLQWLLDYLRTNYTETPTLEHLGKVVGLSPFYLIKLFTEQIGLTPFDYLRTCRVEQVKSRLKAGQSIAEVALETGFYDQSHLNLVFKRHTGLTPRQYQKMTSA